MQFATGVSLADDDSDDDGAEMDEEPAVPEIDSCLGDDTPGVGPWTDEFAD